MGRSLFDMPARAAASCDLLPYVSGRAATIQWCVVTREVRPCSRGRGPAAQGGAARPACRLAAWHLKGNRQRRENP